MSDELISLSAMLMIRSYIYATGSTNTQQGRLVVSDLTRTATYYVDLENGIKCVYDEHGKPWAKKTALPAEKDAELQALIGLYALTPYKSHMQGDRLTVVPEMGQTYRPAVP